MYSLRPRHIALVLSLVAMGLALTVITPSSGERARGAPSVALSAQRAHIDGTQAGTWVIQETPTERTLRGVDFVDPSHGWAVGGEGEFDEKEVMIRTRDGGRSWQLLPFPLALERDRRLEDVDFISRDTGWAVGQKGLVLRTDDGGNSWRQQPTGESNKMRRVQFLNIRTGFVTVAREPYILRTDDGGATWRRLAVPENDGLSVVFFLDELQGWGHGGDEVLLRTTDGGETWDELVSGSNRRFYGLFFVDPLHGWISGADIRNTTDGGDTWTEQFRAGKTTERLFFTDLLTGFGIGDEGTRLHTKDGGRTWVREAEELTRIELHDIAVSGPMHVWTVGNDGYVLYRHDPDALPTATPTPTNTPSPTITPSPTPTSTPTPTATPTPSGPWLAPGEPPWPTLMLKQLGTTVIELRYGNMTAGTVVSATLQGAALFADGSQASSSEITRAGSGMHPLLLRAAADVAPGDPFTLTVRAEGATFVWPGVIPLRINLPRVDSLWRMR